jgi:alanine racemase
MLKPCGECDAERYRRLLKWLVKTGLLSRERCRIDSPASYGDWWVLRKPHGVGVLVLGYGQTEDAAIDAAMEDKT